MGVRRVHHLELVDLAVLGQVEPTLVRILAGLVSAIDHHVVSGLQRRRAFLVEVIVSVVFENHGPLLILDLASLFVVGDAYGQVGTDLGLGFPVLLSRVNGALV